MLDLTGARPFLLRPGGTTVEAIEAIVGPVARGIPHATAEAARSLRSPGLLVSHYAPRLPVRLDATAVAADEALLAFGRALPGAGATFDLSPDGDLTEAAARLFQGLRWLDAEGARLGLRRIAAMAVPGHRPRPRDRGPPATGGGAALRRRWPGPAVGLYERRAILFPPMTEYLTRLNPEQREAVETVDGPLLVLAGAGTGKTRVLTTRFAHILLTGRAAPGQVLAVTFTNKAAREMRERVSAILGRPAEGLWLGTFHALCARMLRRHADLVGLTAGLRHPRYRRPAPAAEAGDGGGAARREALGAAGA